MCKTYNKYVNKRLENVSSMLQKIKYKLCFIK